MQNYRLEIVLYDGEETTNALVSKSPSNNFRISLLERVRILDKNDHSPQFLKKSYHILVKENVAKISLNRNKSRIEVFDLDASEKNSRLNFRIMEKNYNNKNQSDISNRFSIDATNNNFPILVLLKPFDYETDGSSFEFTLVAYDVDNSSDSTLITVIIQDANDNAPLFMNENATLIIKENMQINSFIGQVNSSIMEQRKNNNNYDECNEEIQMDFLRKIYPKSLFHVNMK
jgi:hypothetical protein